MGENKARHRPKIFDSQKAAIVEHGEHTVEGFVIGIVGRSHYPAARKGEVEIVPEEHGHSGHKPRQVERVEMAFGYEAFGPDTHPHQPSASNAGRYRPVRVAILRFDID